MGDRRLGEGSRRPGIKTKGNLGIQNRHQGGVSWPPEQGQKVQLLEQKQFWAAIQRRHDVLDVNSTLRRKACKTIAPERKFRVKQVDTGDRTCLLHFKVATPGCPSRL